MTLNKPDFREEVKRVFASIWKDDYDTLMMQLIFETELEEIWNRAIEAAANEAKDFSWILPMVPEPCCNETSDDAACSVAEQISEKIRALKVTGEK